MNADLKRVRDGPLDEVPSSTKRRALSLTTPPPDISDDGDMEDWMNVLENRRKEAIYRQMLEYRRSYEQEARKTNQLEAQKRVLEASVQAVEICWQQVVSVMQNLAGQAITVKEEELLQPSLDCASTAELDKALQSRAPATTRLIRSFSDLANRNALQPASSSDVQKRSQKLEMEASSLRSQTKQLENQVSALKSSNWQLSRDLQNARKSADRHKMELDKVDLARREGVEKPATPNANNPNGSGHATPNGKLEEDQKPDVGIPMTALLPDHSESEQLAVSRLTELQSLRSKHTLLQREVDQLRLASSGISEDTLRGSPFFQIYLHKLAFHHSRAEDLQQRYHSAEKRLDDLRGSNLVFKDAIVGEVRGEIESLRASNMKKDTDAARLRGQRDELMADLAELRAKDTEKMAHVSEMERLANARRDRITLLTSEVSRLKGAMGAQAGSTGYLAFLKGDGGIDGDYVKSLEEKVQALTDQIAALHAQLQSVASDPAAALSEAGIRVELEETRRSLGSYERIHGKNVEATEDVKEMAAKLEANEKERTGLRLQLDQANAATNALYTEVEGLSKLWEELEKTTSSKVFELRDTELKISRLATEKAKADNRYFAAMRVKESIDGEAKSAQRTVEKQLKLMEKSAEVEKALNSQLAASEQSVTQLKNAGLNLQTRLAAVTSDKSDLEIQLQQTQKMLMEAQQIMHTRVGEAAAEQEARLKYQEEAESSARAVKKLKERQEAVAAQSDMSAGEWELVRERDKLWGLLRCSCCSLNFKQQVITKCMHTFCKSCLDGRIASRQRKCPACGLAFAKEDVQTLYWQ